MESKNLIVCMKTSTSCGMSLKRELKTTDREELPELPVGQKMRTRDEVRVKYVDDASVAVKLLINELLKNGQKKRFLPN